MNKDLTYLTKLLFLSFFISCDSPTEEIPLEYPQSMEIFDQSTLDKFAQKGYEVINGDLFLYNIEDISTLHSIRKINGNLIISSTNLKSLYGLHNLQKIGNDLTITWNKNLNDISALSNIDSLHGELSIEGQSTLQNLQGFDNLSYIGENIILANNGFEFLEGFESLKRINGTLEISTNEKLQEINGFKALEKINVSLKIEWNSELRSIEGLNNLESLNYGIIYIEHNHKLSNFCGLQQIKNFIMTPIIENNLFNPTIEDIKAGRCKP